ncbi:hypothetical protein G6F42_013756 [Rhizopus arrhizus]|nr:hypothetical protein G6F42_013756 [Rhizopus arrhizus]
MRTVFAISSAIALFATSAFASKNADFNPVNFVDEVAAAPTSLTNEFVTFRWKGEEAVANESFDVNVENTARIQVTDFKNRGDSFEVFDNGKSLGMTTKVDALKDEEVFAATPEEALNDDRFSKGIFDLAKGEHKITIKAMGPYEAGTAAIRILDHANVDFHKKGGKDHHDDDDKDDDDHDDHDDHDDKKGGKGRWHKGGEDHHEEGGWNKGGEDHEGGGHKDGKWEHKRPTEEEIDLSHTITYTKTKWVVQKPTHIPPIGIVPL